MYPLPNRLLGRLYYTFVLPLLDYCNVVWSPSSVQFFRRFQRIHSEFCSLVPTIQGFSCCTLAERRRFHAVTEFFIDFHHCIWQILLGMLQLLPRTLEETIIVYLCLVRTSYVKTVFITREHKFGTL